MEALIGAIPASLWSFFPSLPTRGIGGRMLPSPQEPGGLEPSYQRRLVGLFGFLHRKFRLAGPNHLPDRCQLPLSSPQSNRQSLQAPLYLRAMQGHQRSSPAQQTPASGLFCGTCVTWKPQRASCCRSPAGGRVLLVFP